MTPNLAAAASPQVACVAPREAMGDAGALPGSAPAPSGGAALPPPISGERIDEILDAALEETFPASDPVSITRGTRGPYEQSP
jgi:hypothetical protein